jgi:hypothetical protein
MMRLSVARSGMDTPRRLSDYIIPLFSPVYHSPLHLPHLFSSLGPTFSFRDRRSPLSLPTQPTHYQRVAPCRPFYYTRLLIDAPYNRSICLLAFCFSSRSPSLSAFLPVHAIDPRWLTVDRRVPFALPSNTTSGDCDAEAGLSLLLKSVGPIKKFLHDNRNFCRTAPETHYASVLDHVDRVRGWRSVRGQCQLRA